jgi:hypothetical protein
MKTPIVTRTNSLLLMALTLLSTFISCDNNDPVEEPLPELINDVTLVFTTDAGSTTVSVNGTDPDGEGPQGIVIDSPIELNGGKTYDLQILLKNTLQSKDVSAEVAAEGTDHMFFFGFSEGMFSDPTGDGNIDHRADDVNYIGQNATDANGLPLGLGTLWRTAATTTSGQLRIILKHQPGLKTAASGSDVGETDLDVFFDVIVR